MKKSTLTWVVIGFVAFGGYMLWKSTRKEMPKDVEELSDMDEAEMQFAMATGKQKLKKALKKANPAVGLSGLFRGKPIKKIKSKLQKNKG